MKTLTLLALAAVFAAIAIEMALAEFSEQMKKRRERVNDLESGG